MPRSEATPKADLTFIVGDPRSRQNLSRIRAHASRATKRPVGDFEDLKTATPLSTGVELPKSGHTPNEPRSPHRSPEPPDPHHRPRTPASHAASHSAVNREAQLPRANSGEDQSASSHVLAASTLDAGSTPCTVPPYPPSRCFSTQGSTVGTWWERYPDAQGSASGFHSFDPHKRFKLLGEPESAVSASTGKPEQSVDQDRHVGADERVQQPYRLTSPSGPDSLQCSSTEEESLLKKKRSATRILKHTKLAQQKMQSRWRVGNGPSKSLVLPPEHPQTQFETVLLQCSNFYQNAYETTWKPLLRQNSALLEAQSDYEMFYESMLSAAGLIEAGQVNKAAHVIRCIMEMLVNLMHQSHPQAYYFFLNLSLQTSSSALAQLRAKTRQYLAPLSERLLGPDHPITQVLRLEIPLAAREQVETAVMCRVRDFHLQTFGTDSNQSISVTFIFARMLLDKGQTQHALTLVSSAIAAAERAQGMNSLVAVYLITEMTAIYLSATPPDTSIVPELHLSDVIRRLQVIEQHVAKLPEDSMDAQKLTVAIVHGKIVALRMLGRLHSLRKNFGAAIQVYSQVLEYGMTTLGPDAVPVHLAQADLEATKLEELRSRMEEISMASSSVDGKAPAKTTKHEFHIAKTALGDIRSVNRCYLGELSEDIPAYNGMVVGFTVVGMPTFGHTKVL